MSVADSLSDWKLGEHEVAMYCCQGPYGPANMSVYQLHIPTLMPAIPFGKPKPSPASLNKSCFVNDNACKPAVNTRISTQNYISVPMYDNQRFQQSIFWHGDKLRVEFFDEDPERRFVTNTIDNSSNPP